MHLKLHFVRYGHVLIFFFRRTTIQSLKVLKVLCKGEIMDTTITTSTTDNDDANNNNIIYIIEWS